MDTVVLIAEDDAELRGLFQKFLREHGYCVETATDGVDCLDKLRRLQPAVLVLDLELLWGGGDGVLTCLGAEDSLTRTAVILTAAAGTPPDLTESQVIKFLPKPFGLSTLLQTVRFATGNGCEKPFNGKRNGATSEFLGL